MSISLLADSVNPQGYVLVNGTSVATFNQSGTLQVQSLSASTHNASITKSTTLSAGSVTITPTLCADNINVNKLTVVGNISATGTIYATGFNSNNLPIPDKQFKQFKNNNGDRYASTYGSTNAFISNTNKLYVCGYHQNGFSLGFGGDYVQQSGGFVQTQLPLDVNEYVVNYYQAGHSSFALTNLGYLYSIGANNAGELGVGDRTERKIWTKIPGLSGVVSFACSNQFLSYSTCLAVVSGGLTYGWGYPYYGALGIPNPTGYTSNSVTTPVIVNSLSSIKVSKVFTFGDNYNTGSGTGYSNSFAIDTNGQLYGTGINSNNSLGLNNGAAQVNFFTAIPGVTASNVWGAMYSTNAWTYILSGSQLLGTGYNGLYNLGLGDATARAVFTPIISNVKTIAIGADGGNGGNVIALLNDNTVATWGYNNNGCCGNGTASTSQQVPYNPGLTNIKKVQIAGSSNCTSYALDLSGNLWGAGYNGYYQLGNGTNTQGSVFSKVIKDLNIFFVDFDTTAYTNSYGFIAADTLGYIYGCGYNAQGNTGVPYIYNVNTRVPVITRTTIN